MQVFAGCPTALPISMHNFRPNRASRFPYMLRAKLMIPSWFWQRRRACSSLVGLLTLHAIMLPIAIGGRAEKHFFIRPNAQNLTSLHRSDAAFQQPRCTKTLALLRLSSKALGPAADHTRWWPGVRGKRQNRGSRSDHTCWIFTITI